MIKMQKDLQYVFDYYSLPFITEEVIAGEMFVTFYEVDDIYKHNAYDFNGAIDWDIVDEYEFHLQDWRHFA